MSDGGTSVAPAEMQRLLKAIGWDNEDEVISWFKQRSDQERRAASTELTHEAHRLLGRESKGSIHHLWETAIAGSASLDQFVKEVRYFDPATVQVLIDRHPAWLTDAITDILERGLKRPGIWYPSWAFPGIRALQIAGVVDEIDTDGYTTNLLFGGGERILAQDEQLLDDGIWRIFKLVGRKGLRLLGPAAGVRDLWIDTLSGLVADGRLDRAQLQLACLEALAIERIDREARWFVALYRSLAGDESSAEADACEVALLDLAEHPKSAARSFALEELAQAAVDGALDDRSRAADAALRVLEAGDATKADLTRARRLAKATGPTLDTTGAEAAISAELKTRRPPKPKPRQRPLRDPGTQGTKLGDWIKSDRFLSEWPTWNLAYALWLVLFRHDDRRAERYFTKAYQLRSDDPEILLQSGRYHEFVLGDLAEAERRYQKAFDRYVPEDSFEKGERTMAIVLAGGPRGPMEPPPPDDAMMPTSASSHDYQPTQFMLRRASFDPVQATESLAANRVRSSGASPAAITVSEIDELIERTKFARVLIRPATVPTRSKPSSFLIAVKAFAGGTRTINDLAQHRAWDPWEMGVGIPTSDTT